jgi:hypothetical protein
MIMSMSVGWRPARSIASRLAFVASDAPSSPGETQRRCSMPVRSTIHSFDVSISLARSSFVTTRSGTAMPIPRMRLR